MAQTFEQRLNREAISQLKPDQHALRSAMQIVLALPENRSSGLLILGEAARLYDQMFRDVLKGEPNGHQL